MSSATGTVYCPSCGEPVEFSAEVRQVSPEGGNSLRVQTYDAQPRHKCKGER